MCSSSLTAIHLACQSIQNGDSEVALAGGVNVASHPNKYLQLSLGGFVSSDGRCRGFGADGDGYVPGEGVGAVLLKSLPKAIADGDRIYAVIKGSALNHGGKTNGYTVPNPVAQGELIKKALQRAKVDPRTIGYLETHGTGTSLGDPIEINGLTRAFKDQDLPRRSVAIGTVKSNIGHLESAAGIAGLTKLLLQLKHRQLAPSLHALPPNPNIDFENVPFYVQTELGAWPAPQIAENGVSQTEPRRAAISSFGAGGSNAHLVLEEYHATAIPSRLEAPAPEQPQLILLSARNEDRLKAYAASLLAFLEKDGHPTEPFATPTPEPVSLDRLRQVAAAIINVEPGEIDPAEDLVEYGFDPVGFARLGDRLNEEFGLDLPPETFSESANLEEIANQLSKTALNAHAARRDHVADRGAAPALADLAYTLQVAREPMEERLALIVTDMQELREKLAAFCQGEKVLDRAYRGNLKADKGKADMLIEGEAGQAFLSVVLQYRDWTKLARLWATGIDVDWALLHEDDSEARPRRLALPGYPFAKSRFWVPTPEGGPTPAPMTASRSLASYLLKKEWAVDESPAPNSSSPTGSVLVLLEDPMKWGIADLLPGMKTILIQNGKKPSGASQNLYPLDFTDGERGGELGARLLQEFGSIADVVDLSDIQKKPGTGPGLESGKIALLQALIKARGREPMRLLHLTRGLQTFQNQRPNLNGAVFAGFIKMLSAEYAMVQARVADLDSGATEPSELAAVIQRELADDGPFTEICYRAGKRFLPYFAETTSPAVDSPWTLADGKPLDEEKVYVITGGTRGIGMEIAGHLVDKGARKLVLMGIQDFPPRESWQERADSADTHPSLAAKLKQILSLERSGARVRIYAGSLAEEKALKRFFQGIRKGEGAIGGVIHCAGLALQKNPAFINKEVADMQRVLEPKVEGLTALARVFADDALDFFVLFSSVSGSIPALAPGMSDYAAANAFMDAFADHQTAAGKTYFQSMIWPNWTEVGMGEVKSPVAEALGLAGLDTQSGLRLFDQAMALPDMARVLPCLADPSKFDPERLSLVQRKTAKPVRAPSETPAPTGGGLAGFALEGLRALIGKELKIAETQLDAHTPFGDYGVDSILLAELVKTIETWLEVSLDPSLLLEFPTLHELAGHLAESFAEPLRAKMPAGDPPTEAAGAAPPEREWQPTAQIAAETPLARTIGTTTIEASATAAPGLGQGPPPKIAVIGMACHFPGASDPGAYWSNLAGGVCSVVEAPRWRWDVDRYYAPTYQKGKTISKWGGFIENIDYFDPAYFKIREEVAPHMDPLVRQFMEVSVQAVRQAGYEKKDLWNRNIGVFAGSRIANYSARSTAALKESIIGFGQNFIAAHTSHFLNFKGPNLVVDSACSSSLLSIHLANHSLVNGESEMALAGGVDIVLDEEAYLMLSEARALSPDGKCHTFDEKANGFVPGEGCGVVVLKLLDKAIADGDRIYGVIDASAINNDGHTMGITTPNPEAQADVIQRALKRGEIDPRTISLIEAHGTGTMIGDPIELKALTKVFRRYTEDSGFCGVGSVKSNFGHLLSAAGIASFMKVVLALHHKKLPPTLHCETPNPRFEFASSPFYPNTTLADWKPQQGIRRAGISSFGFGGTNAHMIVSEVDPLLPDGYQPQREALPPVVFNRKRYWLEKGESAKMASAPSSSDPPSMLDLSFDEDAGNEPPMLELELVE